MMTRLTDGLPLDYRLLLSGYLPEYVRTRDALSDAAPFAELKAKKSINPAAIAADEHSDGDFSRLIREGIPGADSPSFRTCQRGPAAAPKRRCRPAPGRAGSLPIMRSS